MSNILSALDRIDVASLTYQEFDNMVQEHRGCNPYGKGRALERLVR